jgi:hypothetical protein
VIRVRGMLGAPYWALMCLLAAGRFLFRWACFVLFIGSFAALADQIGESLSHFEPRDMIAIAFLAVLFFTASAAWWTTLRNLRSERIWVMAVSLVYFLTVAVFVVWEPTIFDAFKSSLSYLLTGVLGLVVYLPPYRLQLSANVSSYRLNSPDQKLRELHV